MDPKKIKVPEVRVTAHFDPDLYDQFRESLRSIGQITPPIVYEVDGDLVLCDGLHRLQEAIENGHPTVEVAVLTGDMVDVLTKNVLLDHTRGRTPVSQMVTVLKTLYTEYNLDPDQIRDRTGLTRNYIEKLLKISEASESVQQALDQGVIGVGHAFELSRLPFAVQQDEMIAKHQVYRFSVKELGGFIDDVLAHMEISRDQPPPHDTLTPIPTRVYQCEGCKTEVEQRYLRPVLVCPDCFGKVWRLAKASEKEEVESNEE